MAWPRSFFWNQDTQLHPDDLIKKQEEVGYGAGLEREQERKPSRGHREQAVPSTLYDACSWASLMHSFLKVFVKLVYQRAEGVNQASKAVLTPEKPWKSSSLSCSEKKQRFHLCPRNGEKSLTARSVVRRRVTTLKAEQNVSEAECFVLQGLCSCPK